MGTWSDNVDFYPKHERCEATHPALDHIRCWLEPGHEGEHDGEDPMLPPGPRVRWPVAPCMSATSQEKP